MFKIYQLSFLVLISLLVLSCDDTVSPTDEEELPELNYVVIDSTFVVDCDTMLKLETIPLEEAKAAPKATQKVYFSKNLKSDSHALGSIVQTKTFLHYGQPADYLTSLVNNLGDSLQIRKGDEITFSGSVGGAFFQSESFVVSWGSTYTDLITAFDQWIKSNLDPGVSASIETSPAGSLLLGAVRVQSNGGAAIIRNLQMSSNGPFSASLVASTFSFPSTINPLDEVFSSPLRAPAESVDLLAEVYNEGAAFLGLENGDELEVNANVGGQLLGGNKSHVYHSATSTIQDLLDLIKDELKLPLTDATPQKKLSVSINAASSDDNLDDGSIVVRGSQGLDFRISGLTITATNSDGDNWMPSFFMKNVVTKVIQEPRDNTKHKTSIDIYDALGISYKMDVLFVHNNEPGVWRWYLEFPEGGEVITAGEGDLTFGLQGTVSRAIADDKMGTVTFVPKNGSEKVLFLLEFGGPENFEGITQFEDETTAEALAQDGNAPGFLY